MSGPAIYGAINGVSSELARAGIPKSRTNEVDDYTYRSIDDVLERLAPLFCKYRLCVLPRVLERVVVERQDEGERLLLNVAVRVAFAVTSTKDGSNKVVEAFGEALDAGDKATAKAMTAAYKTAMTQTFCIPVAGAEDPDRASHKLAVKKHLPEPVQGWDQWGRDIVDIVAVCESEHAIDMVQERNRELLLAINRERPDLYADLGRSFTDRRELLRHDFRAKPSPKHRNQAPTPTTGDVHG